MKHILFFSLIVLSICTFGQNISDCSSVKFKEKADYKNAEPCIITLSEYVLTQPMIGYNDETHNARKIVYAWVEGTPDHTFSLNKNIMDLFKDENLTLFNVYVCCLANASLTQDTDMYKFALELLVNYVKNPERKVAQTKSIKKLISNWENGTIDKYLQN